MAGNVGRPRTITHLVDANGCWLWQGGVNGAGYGPHVRYYTESVGPIPEGLELDHTCRVRRCVNPDHLEPVTSSENKLRIPTCHAGHEWTEANTYYRANQRFCRECRKLYMREYRRRAA